MLDHSRGELLEEREHLAPHPCPQEPRIGVRRILGERNSVAFDVSDDIGAPRVNQRAEAIFAPGGQDGQTSGASTSEQAQEHRLRTIVGVMGRDEKRGPELLARALESAVPKLPRPRLEIRARIDLHPLAPKRNTPSARELGCQLELCVCLDAQAVVDATCEQREPDALRENGQNVQQRHRIHSTRHAQKQRRTRFDVALVPQAALCQTKQCGRMRTSPSHGQ